MENLDLLEKLGKIAGIAGIAVGALVLIFGGIIQKNIFPGMTKEQGFRVIRMMIISASVLAIMGIVAWVYTSYQSGQAEKEAQKKVVRIEGYVKDDANRGLPNVEIKLRDNEEIFSSTDSEGRYILKVIGSGVQDYTLIYQKTKYTTKSKTVTVDYETHTEKPVLVDMILSTAEAIIVDDNPSNTTRQNEQNNTPNTTNNQQGTTDITLLYAGDQWVCTLDLNINVGGRGIRPSGNTVELKNVPLGNQNYTISGLISCSIGSCTARGQDIINITPNGTYYIVWIPEQGDGVCEIGLLDQDQYDLLNGF